MEKIDNIQKEEIGGEHTLNEVPSESEYETETDDEVYFVIIKALSQRHTQTRTKFSYSLKYSSLSEF